NAAVGAAGVLLRRGAAVNVQDQKGRTPLVACLTSASSTPREHPEWIIDLMDRLLRHGADPNLPEADGTTPLQAAACRPWGFRPFAARATTLLLKAGANPNQADQHGHTPLHCAASRGLIAPAGRLLRAGADINARSADGRAPLDAATTYRQTRMVRWLLAHGAEQSNGAQQAREE
ncbi:MAG TPA: ankyrin repeat domain-containing protein, partial [Armatimonadota bacterium]|nr:ankyrin repeat domain-containing protein [Armatimonadota bacterium]